MTIEESPNANHLEKPEDEKEKLNKVFAESKISQPLFEMIEPDLLMIQGGDYPPESKTYDIIIDVNPEYPGGSQRAREKVWLIILHLREIGEVIQGHGIDRIKSVLSDHYIFAKMNAREIQRLLVWDLHPKDRRYFTQDSSQKISKQTQDFTYVPHAIRLIWNDFEMKALISESISTIKADTAIQEFDADGRNITWAVLDSGIESTHPHFQKHENLKLKPPLAHLDFTEISEKCFNSIDDPLVTVFSSDAVDCSGPIPKIKNLSKVVQELQHQGNALSDNKGHGTPVAGIIAGECEKTPDLSLQMMLEIRDTLGNIKPKDPKDSETEKISGIAPKCKLISFKVLNSAGTGKTSSLLAALAIIRGINKQAKQHLIHGINLSAGYPWEPDWYACGQSPICVEVNRLVNEGVVVVIAAGNTGNGIVSSDKTQLNQAGFGMTIQDPGNAELAITVGATHRYDPETYGVSFFSSKGPTSDGRDKPDLIAPGERILSCQNQRSANKEKAGVANFIENTGTSFAAPHVSGAIAAFLSVHQELIGKPKQVKEIFLSTATDLKRNRSFQGRGLVNLKEALELVNFQE